VKRESWFRQETEGGAEGEGEKEREEENRVDKRFVSLHIDNDGEFWPVDHTINTIVDHTIKKKNTIVDHTINTYVAQVVASMTLSLLYM
jgi:hypothetical protein